MKKVKCCAAVLLMGIAAVCPGAEINQADFVDATKKCMSEYDGAFVLLQVENKKILRFNPDRCSEKLSPCSTFKIANALCGLESRILQNENTVMKWDGKVRFFREWNRDLTLKEAMAVSSVPHFQSLARRIGRKRMQAFLQRINYGNRDITGPVDRFWLNGPLRISADEQAEFLRRMVAGELPVSAGSVRAVKKCMLQSHAGGGMLYGKTGSGYLRIKRKMILGWFAGFLKSKSGTWVFALNIKEGPRSDGRTARKIAVNILEKLQLL